VASTAITRSTQRVAVVVRRKDTGAGELRSLTLTPMPWWGWVLIFVGGLVVVVVVRRANSQTTQGTEVERESFVGGSLHRVVIGWWIDWL
jgi:hypothetical protein